MSHVSLEVADLDRALDFYHDVFGMQIMLDRKLEGPEFETVTGVNRWRAAEGLISC
jgi:catechol 2,3-dioxygenase-like lactoylglutathione lyase family enzyme